MKKIFFYILSLNILLNANCDIDSLKSDCNIDGYSNNDESYEREYNEYKEILIFKDDKLKEINRLKSINDIMDYNNEDMENGMVELECHVHIFDKTGEYSSQQDSSKDCLKYLEPKIDLIKNNEGYVEMVTYFSKNEKIAAKRLRCQYNIVKSNCNTCNYLEGISIGDNECTVETIITKEGLL